jgi:S-adenosylmethionine:diacylglycerol 3-amino-3-carboxypropyl transferase
MYEDPEIEIAHFLPGGRIFCVASAGDTARALSARHEVVAVDVNPRQLAYARRRLAGEPAEAGTAERVMRALRRLLPLAGVGRDELASFLQLDDLSAQVARWDELATRRFRLGVELLLSVVGLRAFYDAPFLDGLPPHFGRVLLRRLARGFARHPNRTNAYARLLFLGEVRDPGLPVGRVELHGAEAADFLERQPQGSFDGFTISNILDGASAAQRARLFAALRHAATPNALLVRRSFGEPVSAAGEELAARDRSMLWGVVEATPVGALP